MRISAKILMALLKTGNQPIMESFELGPGILSVSLKAEFIMLIKDNSALLETKEYPIISISLKQ
jgi:hypothetical protein